jgi:DNA-directed RNA polymerase specialized sigma24 family protein
MSAPFDQTPDDRLSRINTVATLSPNAQFERYHLAARKYVAKLVCGDEDATQEILVELMNKFRDGLVKKWQGRGQGRFRDYLKTTLRNEVRDYARQQSRRREQLWSDLAHLPDVEAPSDAPDTWISDYVQDLLARVRKKIAVSSSDPVILAILESGSAEEDMTSAELAARLSERTGIPFSAASVRQRKHRVLPLFARLLRDEVASELESPTPESVEAELRILGLLRYVEKYLKETAEDDR